VSQGGLYIYFSLGSESRGHSTLRSLACGCRDQWTRHLTTCGIPARFIRCDSLGKPHGGLPRTSATRPDHKRSEGAEIALDGACNGIQLRSLIKTHWLSSSPRQNSIRVWNTVDDGRWYVFGWNTLCRCANGARHPKQQDADKQTTHGCTLPAKTGWRKVTVEIRRLLSVTWIGDRGQRV
jgi:hypothetical protein